LVGQCAPPIFFTNFWLSSKYISNNVYICKK
jgi:hypothetical protein